MASSLATMAGSWCARLEQRRLQVICGLFCLAVLVVGPAGAYISFNTVDNSSADELSSYVTQDLIFDTQTDWLSAMLVVELDGPGMIYQSQFGSSGGRAPSQALINGVVSIIPPQPALAFDTYVSDGRGGNVNTVSPVDLGYQDVVFNRDMLAVGWYSTAHDDIGILDMARITLSDQAVGSWRLKVSAGHWGQLYLTGDVTGGRLLLGDGPQSPVAHGGAVPEPETLPDPAPTPAAPAPDTTPQPAATPAPAPVTAEPGPESGPEPETPPDPDPTPATPAPDTTPQPAATPAPAPVTSEPGPESGPEPETPPDPDPTPAAPDTTPQPAATPAPTPVTSEPGPESGPEPEETLPDLDLGQAHVTPDLDLGLAYVIPDPVGIITFGPESFRVNLLGLALDDTLTCPAPKAMPVNNTAGVDMAALSLQADLPLTIPEPSMLLILAAGAVAMLHRRQG